MNAAPDTEIFIDDDHNVMVVSWTLELLCQNKVGAMVVAHKTTAMAKVSFVEKQEKMRTIDLCYDPTRLMNTLAKLEMIPFPRRLSESKSV